MRGSEPEGCSRRNVQVNAGPNRRNTLLKALARVAFEAQTHRLRPEGSLPRMSSYLRHLN
jgi:hypothetical protein